MSATLARLRQVLDDPILVRQGREMTPTPLAESLTGPIREILDKTSIALSNSGCFDPLRDSRTFSIAASDTMTFVFLRPLLRALADEAPNIRLHLHPIGNNFVEELRRNRVDLLLTAIEAIENPEEFNMCTLFPERMVCVVDANNPDIQDSVTLEQFLTIPSISTYVGRTPSIAEQKLLDDGYVRNIEITTTFLLSCFLVSGSRMLTLVHERLARQFEHDLNLKLLPPPCPLIGITQTMFWTQRNEVDAGHRWLRERIARLAAENFT